MKEKNKGNAMMPMIIGIVVLAVIAGGAYYFMNMSSYSDETMMVDDADGTTMMEESTPSGEAMMAEADVEVTIEGGMFYFEPNVIEAKVGDTVKVTLNNVEGMHDFVVDEFDAATEVINAGETTTVTFVVDEAGDYEFYCSVMNHRDQGMVGTLVVTE